MPELPEVETVRRGLDRRVTGAVIRRVEIFRDSCVRLMPGGAAQFRDEVTDMTCLSVARRGKFLWIPLGNGPAEDAEVPEASLSAHLGMSGQFRIHSAEAMPEPHPHCRARLSLQSGAGDLTLDFLDQRTFGYLHAEELRQTEDGHPAGTGTLTPYLPQSVAHIARDALDPALNVAAVVAALGRGTRGIKQVLLDQTVMSGVGNIYADEALWRARVHPTRPAHTVSFRAATTVVESVQQVMADALKAGGTSFDSLYVNVNGESGYFARDLDAYGREHEPCSRCGASIRRERVSGRSTHWCPSCQRRYAPRRNSTAVRAKTPGM